MKARIGGNPHKTAHVLIALAILGTGSRTVSAGTNVWTSVGPDGGTVIALAIDPKDSNVLYVGTPAAGLFKSPDGGANWHTASSGLGPGPVTSIAIDAQAPSTIYVLNNGSMLKSTDGGQSWNPASLPQVAAMALDPRNPGTVYAAACSALFKSTDGAATWSAVYSASAGDFCYGALVIDPQSSRTLYALTYDGIFRTTDGGATWSVPLKQKLIGLSGSQPATCDDWGYYLAQATGQDAPAPEALSCFPNGNRDAAITVDQYMIDLKEYAVMQPNQAMFGLIAGAQVLVADSQDSGTLYAEYHSGVYKSTDGGQSWNPANSGLPNYSASSPAFTADSTHPGTLYLGTSRGVYKSTDGAQSWNLAGLLPNTYPYFLAADPQNPSTVYAGSSSGLQKSVDGAASWSPPMSSGLTASDVYDLALSLQSPGTVFAVAASGAGGPGLFKSTNGGTSWAITGPAGVSTNFILSGGVAVGPESAATIYAEGCCIQVAPNPVSALFRSTDGGTNWVNTGASQKYLGRLVVDPQNPSTLYTIGGFRIYESADGGASWSERDSGLVDAAPCNPSSSSCYIDALAIDGQSPSKLYAARSHSDGGCVQSSCPPHSDGIFQSTDAGGTWSAVNLGWDAGLFDIGAGALVADPQTPGTLYAGTQQLDCQDYICPDDYYTKASAAGGAGLFKSTDGGQSWATLNGLPAGDVSIVTIDPRNPSTLYVVSYLNGIFRSTDGGASWIAVNSGLTATYVSALIVDGQTPSTVYAATSGNGVVAITFAPQ